VNEFGISAYGNNLGIDRLEILVLLCQSSKLRGSDKGEVCGIEEEHCPFFVRFQFCQAYLPEISF
jgi:hypothetical protein